MLGKGFTFAVVGAVVGALVWFVIIEITGWSLWVLAPIVGGAAGYGMMRGTQMRGGFPAGVLAAGLTLFAIFGVRFIVVNNEIQSHLAVSEENVINEIAYGVAEEWEEEGYEVWDEQEEDYLPEVYDEAADRWTDMSETEQEEFMSMLTEGSDEAAALFTPFALLFDFGLFGTFCAVLAAGTAFKTGSTTLEGALIERGEAIDVGHAAIIASDMRAAEGGGFFARLGREEPTSPKTAPMKPAGTPGSSCIAGQSAAQDQEARRRAA